MMSIKMSHRLPESPGISMTLGDDGYVRLTSGDMRSLCMRHLVSGLDAAITRGLGDGARWDPITGFTEWVSATIPAITIGWDWRLNAAGGALVYSRLGAPRSNVMVISDDQQDLGTRECECLLSGFVDALAWQQEVAHEIRRRYR